MKYSEKKCKRCDRSFMVSLQNKRAMCRVACSRSCSNALNGEKNLGKKRSEELKRAYSIKYTGAGNPFFGKTHSEKSKALMSVSSQWDASDDRLNHSLISHIEMSVLDGLLLGDGCLVEQSRLSSRFSAGFKFKETCDDIVEALPSLEFSPIWKSDKSKSYHLKSLFYVSLLPEHNRWYEHGVKKVPADVRLDSTSCYWWFVGDGYVNKGNVIFCTDSFTEDDILLLTEKLTALGFSAKKRKTQNRIIITKKDCEKFLRWIFRATPQYQYKWDNYAEQLERKIQW